MIKEVRIEPAHIIIIISVDYIENSKIYEKYIKKIKKYIKYYNKNKFIIF